MKRVCKAFDVSPSDDFPLKILQWAENHFSVFCALDTNRYSSYQYSSLEKIFALGQAEACVDDGIDAFDQVKRFYNSHDDWLFGYFSYDLKNQLEHLVSENHDGIGFPDMHFFRPIVLAMPDTAGSHISQSCVSTTVDAPGSNRWIIGCLPGFGHFSDPDKVFSMINNHRCGQTNIKQLSPIVHKVSKQHYLDVVHALKNHIKRGDIYEVNYCMGFSAEEAVVDPVSLYRKLISYSPAPFSCIYALDGKMLLSASPERFMKKLNRRIISQPMKGTIGRIENPADDILQKELLANDPKERSENVMIVDLVRNDLSRTAVDGSVKVEELCGIYSFKHVHQMVSTIVSELHPGCHPIDAIKEAFPMGSMTGAPKVRAMQLIEQYENTRRGLFSGSVGYFNPQKDYDFNVVIRSVFYNRHTNYLTYLAGSAITAYADPEREYKECLLKAEAIRQLLYESE